jgi:hypothetical protein
MKNKRNTKSIAIVSVIILFLAVAIAMAILLSSNSNNKLGNNLSGRYEATSDGITAGLEFIDGHKVRLYDSRYDYVQTPTYTLDGNVLTFDTYDPITGTFIETVTGMVSDDRQEIAILGIQELFVKK